MKIMRIDESGFEQRLDRFLLKLYGARSKNSIQKWLRKKLIKVNGRPCKPDYRLILGDEIKLFLPDSLLEASDERREAELEKRKNSGLEKLNILFEDDEILIVIKPQGLLVHPAKGEYKDSLSAYVQDYLCDLIKPTFAPSSVSRLDYNTEGLVLFCKTYEALKKYNLMMREGKIEKFYLLISCGRMLKETTVEGYLVKDEEENTAHIEKRQVDGGKYVKTVFRPIRDIDGDSLVEAELITGRSHQIRASLRHIGHPIAGDKKYGAPRRRGANKQVLACYKLKFEGRVFEYEPACVRLYIRAKRRS